MRKESGDISLGWGREGGEAGVVPQVPDDPAVGFIDLRKAGCTLELKS